MGMVAILAMWPESFEQTFVPHPIEAPYKIWLWLAKRFLRRWCLKSVDDGRWRRPTYKLTNELSAQLEVDSGK